MLDTQGLTIIGYIYLAAEVTGVLLALNVVMQPRSSQGTIAWVVALISMPVITVPLYAFFGRTRFQGYTEALREAAASVEDRMREWLEKMRALAAQPRPVPPACSRGRWRRRPCAGPASGRPRGRGPSATRRSRGESPPSARRSSRRSA